MNNKIKQLVLLIVLLLYNCSYVYAYDYIEPSNEDGVNKKIREIYDLKDQYEILAGKKNVSETYTSVVSNTTYWWPIGSSDTVELNGKIYAKGDPENTIINLGYSIKDSYHPNGHAAIDLHGELGKTNVIASKAGIVIAVQDGMYDNNHASSTDTHLYNQANYVIIQHSDGTTTRYWHLAKGLLVKNGDSVEQGQVIGKVGSSGFSTGPHLDFSIKDPQGNLMNPLDYVDPTNPRAISTESSGSDFLKFLNSWEGSTPVDGDSYVVVNIGDGVRTVGSGVTLENNPARFLSYGINIDDYPTGSKINKEIVDKIELEIINDNKSNIESNLAKNSITLNQHELEGLVSRKYNVGNYNGFIDAYKSYGNTDALYNNWFFNVKSGTKFTKGLTRRRNAEWSLFHEGIYVMNG